MPLEPRLCLHLRSFSQDDQGDWSNLIDLAKAADAAGIDKVLVSDHVVMGTNLDRYSDPSIGGIAGGVQPTDPDGHWLEPVTLLSVIAGATTNVRLGTNVLLAALRRPVVLAKSLSTLDVLSGGRVDLGVGVGWQKEEYDAAGLDFAERGHLLQRTLVTLQELWLTQSSTIEAGDRWVNDLHQMPKPLQEGGIPIWIGGRPTARVARRLARFGSGWIPWGDAAADVAKHIGPLWEKVAAEGGDPSKLRVLGTVPLVKNKGSAPSAGSVDMAASVSALAPLIDTGVTDFVLRIPGLANNDAPEALQAWSTAFRRATGRVGLNP